MKRSLNLTGRGRILRASVTEARLVREDGQPSVSLCVAVDASDEAFTAIRDVRPSPELFAEVRGNAYLHRVVIGTAASPRPTTAVLPDAHLLPPNPTLRIVAVEAGSGRLLARADGIPLTARAANAPSGSVSLLPASFEYLHGLVWRVAADPDEDGQTGPRLLLDERFRDLDLNQRIEFIATVLPEAVRQVVADWYRDLHDDDVDVVRAWRRKVTSLLGHASPPDLVGPEAPTEEQADAAWRDFAVEVARAFAREMTAVDRLRDSIGGEE